MTRGLNLHKIYRFLGAAIFCGFVATAPPSVIGSDHVQWVIEYDITADPAPEGIAVDKPGNIYAGGSVNSTFYRRQSDA